MQEARCRTAASTPRSQVSLCISRTPLERYQAPFRRCRLGVPRLVVGGWLPSAASTNSSVSTVCCCSGFPFVFTALTLYLDRRGGSDSRGLPQLRTGSSSVAFRPATGGRCNGTAAACVRLICRWQPDRWRRTRPLAGSDRLAKIRVPRAHTRSSHLARSSPTPVRRCARKSTTCSQRLRTLAQVAAQVELPGRVKTPIFQVIAQWAAAMRDRGDHVSAIARKFGVDYHTADKAIRWYRQR